MSLTPGGTPVSQGVDKLLLCLARQDGVCHKEYRLVDKSLIVCRGNSRVVMTLVSAIGYFSREITAIARNCWLPGGETVQRESGI